MKELEKRGPEFSDGTPVVLGDGETWIFPRPRLRFFPARDETGKIVMGGGHTFDADYRALYDEMVEIDPEDGYSFWSLRIRIACHLLLRNYTLTDDELVLLLPVDFEDEKSCAMWRELAPVLAARPPRSFPSG